MAALVALELIDTGIVARVSSASPSRDLEPSPGFALLENGTLITGVQARRRARLKPRSTLSLFWDRLGTDPLPRPFPSDLSYADIAHSHLDRLWQELEFEGDGVLLAVPGSHTPRQLGLILGIARASEIPVVGMVDSAVAATSRGLPGKHLIHVDVHLHRSVVTEIAQGREIVRRRVESTDRAGLLVLYDRWVETIAQAFVTHTRFDPLHVAETEQDLFERLPELLAGLGERDTAPLELESAGKTHRIVVAAERLIESAATAYDGILQMVRLATRVGRSSTIVLTARAAGLPGLRDRLAAIGDSAVVVLSEGAAAEGALAHADAIRSAEEALPFVTRLPADGSGAEAAPVAVQPHPNEPRGAPPTHILHEGWAYPITEKRLVLGVAVPTDERGINLRGNTAGISRSHCSLYRVAGRAVVEDHSTHGSFLNDQQIDGTADLVVGDRLRLGIPGIELRLLRVRDDDGTA